MSDRLMGHLLRGIGGPMISRAWRVRNCLSFHISDRPHPAVATCLSAGSSSSLISRILASACPTGMPLQCVLRIEKFAPTSAQHGRSCA